MALSIKTREQFVEDEVAAIQAELPNTFSFPVGSIVRALVDAHSATAIWLQSDIQLVYNRERLATSTGVDVDSFIADFGLTRLPATFASGNVTFARFTPTQQAVVPIGAIVSTFDNTASFAVIIDTTNVNYNPALNGYVLAVNTASIVVPVKALVAGTIGNAQENTITVINSPITGVDTVTNALAFSNGANQQTDAQVRTYFVQYLNSLSKATHDAILFYILTAQPGTLIECNLVENLNYDTDAQQLGYFYAVIDNGTGNPPDALITTISNVVNLVRGLTIRYDIKKAVILTANVTATVTPPAGYTNPTLNAAIVNAIQTYINLLPIGATLFYSSLYGVIYTTIQANVPANLFDSFNVSALLINGTTSDLVATGKESVFPGTITITGV